MYSPSLDDEGQSKSIQKNNLSYDTMYRCYTLTWWRHQMETFSVLLALYEGNPAVTGGFLSQRLVARSSDVVFDLRLNKRFSIQSRRRWFDTLSCSLWRHCKKRELRIYFDLYKSVGFAPNSIASFQRGAVNFLCKCSNLMACWRRLSINKQSLYQLTKLTLLGLRRTCVYTLDRNWFI